MGAHRGALSSLDAGIQVIWALYLKCSASKMWHYWSYRVGYPFIRWCHVRNGVECGVVLDVPEILIRKAAVLFAEQGYDATSVSDIVGAADVTKGALYYYFSAKEDLLFAIHHRFITAEMRQAEEILRQIDGPPERLAHLIVSLVESIAEYRSEVTVFFREMHRLSPAQFDQVREARDAYQQIYEDTISRGQSLGVFRTDIEARILSLALFGQCNWTYTWMRPYGSLTPRQIGERLATLFLDGIAGGVSNNKEATTRGGHHSKGSVPDGISDVVAQVGESLRARDETHVFQPKCTHYEP